MEVAQSLLIVGRMEVSLYSAAAAMNATERWQDLVADNLSSASVPGARQQEISFSAVQAGVAAGEPGSAGNNFVMPLAGFTIKLERKSTRLKSKHLSNS